MREYRPPTAFRRHLKWAWVGIGLAVLSFWGGFAASMATDSPALLAIIAPASVGLFAAGVLVPATLWRRDLLQARRCRGQACPHCLYDLRASPNEGKCPECGVQYVKNDIVRQWRNAERSYEAKKSYQFDYSEKPR